jgi:hypothetical protein
MSNTNIRIKTIELKDGKWAMACGAGKYYASTKSDTQKEAIIRGLKLTAQVYQIKMDKIHSQLEKLGAINPEDTHGYLA